MLSAQSGYKDVVELLIKAGADLTIQDHNNNTALDIAAEMGFNEIVDLLAKANEGSRP